MDKKPNSLAVLAYLWILIVVPFLTDAKNDPFVKFHLKQGLAILVFEAITWFASIILGFVPIIGSLVVLALWLVSLVFTVMGIANVLAGNEKELPLIGEYAKRFNF